MIKKFERIKKDFYNKNYDKINIVNLNDPYINDLINDYKENIKNNNLGIIGLLPIKEIEEYIQIINNIILIENKSYNINNQVEDKKEELEIKDLELDISQKTTYEKLSDKFSLDEETAKMYMEKFWK